MQSEKQSIVQKKIVIGVCTMQRKATSKPMREIMDKIIEYYGGWLEFVMFPEQSILNDPVEQWPLCDCLISFHAADFPLQKAIQYERLRRPYIINDLHRQFDLLDRRKVFRTLARAGIEHPRHGVLIRNRDTGEEGQLMETSDQVKVSNQVFTKPFVEKPISAQDHNIYIYYPSSMGGGSQRLFRKINNRSSVYSPISTVRCEGSYIYEDFIPADGTDVKVYAVGPYYAHAEARKAPGLDGKVERDCYGKEVRYPVILTNKEKLIARRVVMAFGQTVCGFDLLRANGKSFVCDVNGFSFVKTSRKYYEDTAKILGNMILRRLASSLSIPWQIPFQDGNKMNEIRMKRPNQLKEVLELARELLHEQHELRNRLLTLIEANEEIAVKRNSIGTEKRISADVENIVADLEMAEEEIKKWDQVRAVLEMYGHFSGINRKVQLKRVDVHKQASDSDETTQTGTETLLLTLKWGGELTPAGVLQAEALGKLFRTLYPGIKRTDGKGETEDAQGLGFLRLHSTYRHDLKIYSSDEGRVQMTAAAFARGLLALEGELTPILVQMVKSANTDGLLDDDCHARQFQGELKTFLHSALQVDRDWNSDDLEKLNPLSLRAVANALEFIKNPRRMCQEIATHVRSICTVIAWHRLNRPNKTLYLNETWELASRRWEKELREFRRVGKNDEFDISKIPDIYDNVKYDMEHNPELCINNNIEFERMYLCVKNMADIVVPQEYGIRKEGKLSVAQRVCAPLLAKIRSDLHRCIESCDDDESLTRLDPRASQGIATPLRHVRTRLYFTSESHIHSLMNLIRWGGLCDPNDKKWQQAMNFLSGVTEFNYMTQLVLMVYEDTRAESDKHGIDRFHVELLFSPGLYPCFQTEKERIYEGRYGCGKTTTTNASISPLNTGGSTTSLVSNCSVGEGKADLIDGTAISGNSLTEVPVSSDESDDELADVSTVNLVALGEINCNPTIFTNEDLARHSPSLHSRSPKRRHQSSNGGNSSESTPSTTTGLKSTTDLNSTSNRASKSVESGSFLALETSVESHHSSTLAVNCSIGPLNSTDDPSSSRRSRFPYQFKHHTVNLLSEVDNRLISTNVIRGMLAHNDEQKRASNKSKSSIPVTLIHGLCPAVLSTAVISRSSSAPRLQTYKAEDDIAVNEIRRFWPPLRSLETLHDNVLFRQFDEFLQRLMSIRTPMPSPPKTPTISLSRDNSDLNVEPPPSPHRQVSVSPDKTLTDTISRLHKLDNITV